MHTYMNTDSHTVFTIITELTHHHHESWIIITSGSSIIESQLITLTICIIITGIFIFIFILTWLDWVMSSLSDRGKALTASAETSVGKFPQYQSIINSQSLTLSQCLRLRRWLCIYRDHTFSMFIFLLFLVCKTFKKTHQYIFAVSGFNSGWFAGLLSGWWLWDEKHLGFKILSIKGLLLWLPEVQEL